MTGNGYPPKANATIQQSLPSTKQHYFKRNMPSLGLFPDEVEERRLLGSPDEFWNGIDDWDLLEEAARSAGVANPISAVQKRRNLMKYAPLTYRLPVLLFKMF